MFDVIVIGGGSAGSVLAARLSEDADVKVLLVEAGPRDWNPYIHLPAGSYKTMRGPLTWNYKLAPQINQNGITPDYVQARVLGGGSSINAQIYIRGAAEDYDGWAAEGCPGWSYREVLPYFKRSEGNKHFSGEYHGTDGPLAVSDQRHTHSLTKAFVQACQEFGIPYTPDFNGPRQAGCGLYQVTNRNGRRCNAAMAYLGNARRRPNLTIRTGAIVQRIIIKQNRAVAVELLEKGRIVVERADQEIVLTAGAIGSPKILLLSGVGPSLHLREHDIDVVVDLPGVGQNLQDHLSVPLMYNLKGIKGYDVYKRMHRQLWAGAQYAVFRNGPVSATIVEGGAFWWTDKSVPHPDLQFHFEAITNGTSTGNGCTLSTYLLRPRARGFVTLRSGDPRISPNIDPNFLGDPYDVDQSIKAVQIGQEIMRQPAIAKYLVGEFVTGLDVGTHDGNEAYVRTSGRSGYHPVGTCKMGQDRMAVVDPQLKVHGIDGLRVADSSIMPSLISGNTNAPCIMIGEKASDLLRSNHVVPPVMPSK